MRDMFHSKVDRKEALVGIVGLGYVGLPLALSFHNGGFPILGLDINEGLNEDLMSGKSRIHYIAHDRIKEMVDGGRFHATHDFARASEADALLICVPTPLNKYREPDLSYVEATARAIGPYIRKGQLIVLESTTYPGTTKELLADILEQESGLKVDVDFFVAYSPEREDPANESYSTATIPKVVGSATPEGLEIVSALYETVITKVVRVSSPEVAEAVKLTENIFRAVNIALVNELKVIYDKMGIDVWEVIDAAATKPFGFMPFYPGPGLGGHCIPIDPFYLTWKAREFGMHTRFIELAGEINKNMPQYVVDRVAEALNGVRKTINGSRILLVGIAYKKNVDDMRESPSLELLEMLEARGGEVTYFDPYIPVIPPTREHKSLTGRKSFGYDRAKIGEFDAILIATDHDSVNWQELAQEGQLIVDTRNAMRDVPVELRKKIVKA
ncbi:nucleotide sugar dehydrogenase [Pseudorhizobium halotolerans]|uniref:Nucleotide sugar dehydrogenase n=1 Tax=Pseudorhizobium halotolerans TaxID=1233081 RepID=A0ABM8PVL2_9HYPH|nr:nucleotide sugar dehydrogenase [Pseudorhizobium halotolerans]CAD7050814.1 nucleotide sugar dehydrogenase [Pseudorhizobium halotolerans]